MTTQEGSPARRMRSLSPQPGDGICPTFTQYQDTVTASYEIWAKLLSKAKEITDDLHIADDLLDLLQQIPGLYAHDSKRFSISDQPWPQLKYALELVTTTDPACERPIRRTYHCLTLGVLEPLAWQYSYAAEDSFLLAGASSGPHETSLPSGFGLGIYTLLSMGRSTYNGR